MKPRALLFVALVPALASAQMQDGSPVAPDDALIRDLEAKSWVAWKAQDATFFEIRGGACIVASYSLGPLSVVHTSPDSVLVTYRAEQSTRCGTAMVPSPVWATSLYVKRAGKWLNVLYQQTPAT